MDFNVPCMHVGHDERGGKKGGAVGSLNRNINKKICKINTVPWNRGI